MLHTEYRKVMGDNYSAMEELWHTFDRIEETYVSKVRLPSRFEIYHKFMKEKLPLMADRVVKNIRTQVELLSHEKDLELAELRERIVMVSTTRRKSRTKARRLSATNVPPI